MQLKVTICVIVSALSVSTTFGHFLESEHKNVTRFREISPPEWTEPYEDGLWSTLLEEWTLSNK